MGLAELAVLMLSLRNAGTKTVINCTFQMAITPEVTKPRPLAARKRGASWSVNMRPPSKQCIVPPAPTRKKSKGTVGPAVDYRPQGEALLVISADLISELLHCLSTLPDPWPLAKITIDMEKPSQWVSKLCRLYFSDEYAKRTVGLPSRRHVPDIAGALRAVLAILPKLEAKMIEFLAEWVVTLLMPASHVLEVRAPHLSFMMLKEY